jgi:hypothetical protein
LSEQNPHTWAPFPFLAPVTVTKNPSPQTLQNQQLQMVIPTSPLESAFAKTAGSHPSSQKSFSFLAALFLFSFHSLHQERFTTLFPSKGSALFLKIAGCMGFLPILEVIPVSSIHLSFQSLPRCPFCNSFLLMVFHLRGVPSLCLPTSLPPYFITSSPPPGAGNHLSVFWTSHQYRGAGRSCTLMVSQSEVRL